MAVNPFGAESLADGWQTWRKHQHFVLLFNFTYGTDKSA
jgi:hypothetical protein